MNSEQRQIDLRIRLHIARVRLAAAMVRLNSVPRDSALLPRIQQNQRAFTL